MAKLRELADTCGGILEGDGNIEISAAAPIESASSGDITFIANNKYKKYIDTTAASAVVVHKDLKCERSDLIRHEDPYYAFALILDILYPDAAKTERRIHDTAVISETSKIGDNCTIGAQSHIGNNSRIGDGCRIDPQVYIGDNVTLGENCHLFPGVIINRGTRIGDNSIVHSGTVVGSDGFGYARHSKGIKKVKQIGWVEIGNDVEIGANCTIDRGALGPTKIGNHVKIDNLVQIAHNVEIGDFSIIVSQVGISGSTKLGRGVILAGQVGLVGHIEIGDGVQVGAQSGVSKDIPAGKKYFGYPAREIMETKRIEASLKRLPELLKRVKKLEDK